jgi:hypothetical protein
VGDTVDQTCALQQLPAASCLVTGQETRDSGQTNWFCQSQNQTGQETRDSGQTNWFSQKSESDRLSLLQQLQVF